MAFQKKHITLKKKYGPAPMRKRKIFKRVTKTGTHPVDKGGGGKGWQPQAPPPINHPPGVSAEQWAKRTPCPGCGSRWHRDCRGKSKGKGNGGKTAAFVEGGRACRRAASALPSLRFLHVC